MNLYVMLGYYAPPVVYYYQCLGAAQDFDAKMTKRVKNYRMFALFPNTGVAPEKTGGKMLSNAKLYILCIQLAPFN